MRILVLFLISIALCMPAGCVKRVSVRGEETVNCFDDCKKNYERCQNLAESNKARCIAQGSAISKCDSNYTDNKSGCIDLKADCQNTCL